MKIFASITFVLICLSTMLGSCGVNSNLMFKEVKGDSTVLSNIPMTPSQNYRISPDDRISFTLAANDGAPIIESISGLTSTQTSYAAPMEYTIRSNGKVKLPLVGLVEVGGLTVQECEEKLVLKYSTQYETPFVQVKVTNQRVIVFPGNGSDAKVIPLLNSNTTLMEALAQAGGITDRGKANTIKLMRKENGKRVVYKLDLSTMEGLKNVDMIVQANDYIYVEPTPELSKEIAEDIVPIVSLLSSSIIIISAISVLK
ncbi:MAG: polysaccharide biosynthesis/export family protein [Crocinitomicaceae bacterium]|jgi:polysaccharide biosynthesis/export protein|nr:polysaccharide biosynthesis/export family protein [Crocinitomicaceae bacterium]MDG1657126.1 polysaccharide biosynthesis/export family protein [Crocinitomicaceae bacterium]